MIEVIASPYSQSSKPQREKTDTQYEENKPKMKWVSYQSAMYRYGLVFACGAAVLALLNDGGSTREQWEWMRQSYDTREAEKKRIQWGTPWGARGASTLPSWRLLGPEISIRMNTGRTCCTNSFFFFFDEAELSNGKCLFDSSVFLLLLLHLLRRLCSFYLLFLVLVMPVQKEGERSCWELLRAWPHAKRTKKRHVRFYLPLYVAEEW